MDKVAASTSQSRSGLPSRSARTPPTASCSPRRGGRRSRTAGAQPQRLLWASTSTKDPNASDVLYIEALAAPDTINTIPDDTLRAFADHGRVTQTMPADGGDAEEVLAQFTKAGVDVAALGGQLQREGAQSFDDSWNKLMRRLASKSDAVTPPARSTKASS